MSQLVGLPKMIEGDDKIRTQKCMMAVKNALDQFDCDLHPVVTMSPAGQEWGFRIVAKPRGAGHADR